MSDAKKSDDVERASSATETDVAEENTAKAEANDAAEIVETGDSEPNSAVELVDASASEPHDDNSSRTKFNYGDLDKAGMNPYVALILNSLLCGVMIIIFSVVQGFTKYAFSLIALYAGYKFFQKYDSIKLRIALIILSVVVYFIGFFIFVFILIINEWNIPGLTDKILEVD